MRELLEACLDLDVLAEEVYRRFANDSDDPELARLFEQMRADEDQGRDRAAGHAGCSRRHLPAGRGGDSSLHLENQVRGIHRRG